MKVLVVGDVVQDVYTEVTSTRNCPEEPAAPVLDRGESRRFLGCAGNVLRNLAAFPDLDLEIVGGMGLWEQDQLRPLCRNGHAFRVSSSEGITKERLVHGGKILARVDSSRSYGRVMSVDTMDMIIRSSHADLIVVSDYGFGTVTDEVASLVVQLGKPVYVDSKRKDLTVFRGAEVFKLNKGEWAQQVSLCATTDDHFVESLCKFCVVTLGAEGSEVRIRSHAPRGGYSVDSLRIRSFPTDDAAVVDVTGCGDTYLAALVYAHGIMKRDIFESCRFATCLASAAVTELGPYAPTPEFARECYLQFFEED